jgi:hypothetical protein
MLLLLLVHRVKVARGNPPALDELLKRYDVIFKQQLGKIKDLKATIRVQSMCKGQKMLNTILTGNRVQLTTRT